MKRWGPAIDATVLVMLLGAGLASPYGVARWYGALAAAFVGIAGSILALESMATWISERSSARLQGPRTRPRLAWRGARDTALASLVAASLLAWPLARMGAGEPTGLVWTLEEAGGLGPTIGGNLLAVLVLDAWLYWKHRLLHTGAFFAFHRAHHAYRDPTSLSSFAVGPVESLLTFWPIVLVAFPWAPHYAPVYFTLVGVFVVLNLYLHSGVSSRLVEATLPRLYVNTSAFHNRHHANADVNFGEALTLWDHLLGTREGDRRDPRPKPAPASSAGPSAA
ncbi:MAG: sterol desaturase family protein [Sandaracinaceae bacterium]|nr:sterol desaturase family protein [Sandaracinaceae bacterium]